MEYLHCQRTNETYFKIRKIQRFFKLLNCYMYIYIYIIVLFLKRKHLQLGQEAGSGLPRKSYIVLRGKHLPQKSSLVRKLRKRNCFPSLDFSLSLSLSLPLTVHTDYTALKKTVFPRDIQ